LVAQFLFPKHGGTRWFVESHRPRGFKTELTQQIDWNESGWPAITKRVTRARVCGPDPHALWHVDHHSVIHWVDRFGETYDEIVDEAYDLAFPNDGPVRHTEDPQEDGGTEDFDEFLILVGPPARIQLTSLIELGVGWSEEDSTTSAPLLEDMSCPAIP
jgi:hypothetical protein